MVGRTEAAIIQCCGDANCQPVSTNINERGDDVYELNRDTTTFLPGVAQRPVVRP